MQRILKKTGLPAFIIFCGAILALVATALILAVGYRDQVRDLKATLLDRCSASTARWQAFETYYDHLLVNLDTHPSPQSGPFNAQLRQDATQLRDEMRAAVAKGCEAYR